MKAYDCLVVGAGPGGAVCARRLAEAGVRTGLIDRLAPPRYKICGGGVVGRAAAALGGALEEVSERQCFEVELNLVDEGLGFRVRRDEPVVVMTMRAELDALLVERAVDAGAELLAPCTFERLEGHGSDLEVRTDRGALRTSFLVGADGPAGRVARAAGWAESPGAIPALESEVEVDREGMDRYSGSARFDFGVVPDGYCWVFPKREHLSVGCLSTGTPSRRSRGAAGSGGRLRSSLERYLAQLGLGRPRSRRDHGFVIPVRPRRGPLARGGVFLVGDAAGLADPVTCEGISSAARSGALAARAIADSAGVAGAAERAYVGLLEAELLPELRRARILARLLYGHPRLQRAAFRRLGRPLAERMTDLMAGKLGYRDLTDRPARWLRGLWALARGEAVGREVGHE